LCERDRRAMAWLTDSKVLEKWTRAAQLVDGKVPGAEFVEASQAIISIFDLISGMSIPKGDMEGNATTLGKNLAAGQTVEACVEAELAGGNLKKLIADGKTSTCALLWLSRALFFIHGLLLAMIADTSKSVKDCVLAGYETSLKPHHGFVTRNVFAVAVKAAPYRADFIAKVGPSDEAVMASFKEVMPEFEKVINSLSAFLKAKGIES